MKNHYYPNCHNAQIKEIGSLSNITCKSCLKRLVKRAELRGLNFKTHVCGDLVSGIDISKRLLEQRYIDKEPAIIALAKTLTKIQT